MFRIRIFFPRTCCSLFAGAILFWLAVPLCAASYKDDIGFTDLEDELGADIPDGNGVRVTQMEVETTVTEDDVEYETWILNSTHTDFSDKTITYQSSSSTDVASSHATTVGRYFYGTSLSLAPAIMDIDAYEANDWLGSGFLAYGPTWSGNAVQPHYEWPSELSSPSRVANHSWVGTTSDDTVDADLLKRLDFVVESDEFIQITAVNNGTTQRSLLSGAFNAVTVGLTNGDHASDTTAVDETYVAGRTCPLVVVPLTKTSYANPIVASAAAALVEKGGDTTLSTDPFSQSTSNRDGEIIIYNAERSEVIKAALLAGADRVTHNTWSSDQIDDYCQDSANGLDRRFGAGQVNVYHSDHILAAKEQNSMEDDPDSEGLIGTQGFDFDPAFGGSESSNTTASYFFTADHDMSMLYASLVWNLHIHGGLFYNYDDTATLHDFDLKLYDMTDENNPVEVAVSTSSIDNTENLWVPLTPGHTYRMQVTAGSGQAACLWDYALAWRVTTPPDSDGDTLPDDWEVYHGMNRFLMDSDGDGMVDDYEHTYHLDPVDSGDASEDPDLDGYTNLEEYQGGRTDPQDPDDYPQIVSVTAVSISGMLTVVALLLVLKLVCGSRCRRSSYPETGLSLAGKR